MSGRAGSVSSALVLLVLVLGVWFRVTGIESKVLWHDEVYTRVFASGYQSHDWQDGLYTSEVLPVEQVRRYQRYNPDKSMVDTLRGLAEDEPQHPPVYYLLARWWLGRFGDGIGALRSLSVIAGLAAIPGMYWLCWELFHRRRVAWMGAMLASVSPFFVLYAQEAREYALWGLLVVLATAALLRAIRVAEHEARRPGYAWVHYSVLVALALYTSFSTVAVAIAHVVFIVARERGRVTRVGKLAAISLAGAALAFTPWALTLLEHFEAFQASMAWSKLIIVPRSELVLTLALNASRSVIDLWDGYDHVGVYLIVLCVAVLYIVALVVVVREARSESWVLVLALVAVPIGLLLGPDLIWGGIRSVSARYLIPSWIGLQAALAYLLGRSDSRRAAGAAGLVIAAGALSCAVNASRPAVWTKGVSVALPEVAEVINAADRPLVIGNRERHHPGNLLALSNLIDDDARMQLLWTGHEVGYELPDGGGTVLLFSPLPQFIDQLEQSHHVRAVRRVRDLHVELYELQPE